ncbi:hypothetical protein EA187_13240 [Lujinxingia sediminis]|uniref:DUF481 domain-containing protein n=1 Tax=Lujinxingia sediminis TaxID=2480984 RepID=A0ABY0CSL2_9DELT|nr:hypothetical protein [Lujinxingia sediminis]RVU43172.1 hypothetical protein EA187_13240 [Lujinxingia sediminis]
MRPAWRAAIAMVVMMVVGGGEPREAQAQGGCSATAAIDFGVAGFCQRGVLMAELESGVSLGSYNEAGRFEAEALRPGLSALRVGGGLRLPGERAGRLQLHADAGLLVAPGGASGQATLGTGGRVGARWTWLEDLKLGFDRSLRASRRPFLEVYTHLRRESPVARRELENSQRTMLVASAGVHALKYMTYRDAVGLRMAGGYGAGGVAWSAGVSWTRVEAMRWAAGLKADVHLRSRGPQLRAEVGIFSKWMMGSPHWELSAHLLSDWVGPFGAYRVAQVGPRLGVSLQRNLL